MTFIRVLLKSLLNDVQNSRSLGNLIHILWNFLLFDVFVFSLFGDVMLSDLIM